MTKKFLKRKVCFILSASLLLTGIASGAPNVYGKARLKTKSMTMKVGQKKKITILGVKDKAKYSFKSSSKSTATVSSKGWVKAKKVGKVKITVTEKYKKKTKPLGKVSITIKSKSSNVLPTNGANQASTAPQASSGAQGSTTAPAGTTAPASKTPTSTKKPSKTNEPYIRPDPDGRGNDDGKGLTVPAGYDKVNSKVAGEVIDIEYDSTVIKEGETVKRKAKVVLPKDYDKDKKYPLLVMCHGIGGNETSLAGDNVQNVIWNAAAAGIVEDMVAVFPSCCANEWNGPSDSAPMFSLKHYDGYSNFVNDWEKCLMPYMKENYSIKEGRENTAVCGFSMGGRMTLHLGFALPDIFGYVGAFCPAPGILDFEDLGVSGPGVFTPETFTLPDKYKGFDKTLVMIVKGSSDTVVHKFPQDYTDALSNNKVPHIFYIKKGGHDGSVYKHGLYNFLKRAFKTDPSSDSSDT